MAPPGQARADWSIVVEFAQRLEARLRPGRRSLFPYETPEAVWNEHRETTRGRDLDITGLSWSLLDEKGPQHWPLKEGWLAGRARLYENGHFATPDGRARFHDTPHRPPTEPRDPRYPFSLNTGRLRDQWHAMSRTGTLGRSFGHVAEPSIEMHPQELHRLGLAEGDLVHVTSRRGSIVLPVSANDRVAPAQAFVAMHWGEEFVSGRGSQGQRLAGVNALTLSTSCPQSRQPELKHCAVKVLKAELPWRLVAASWLPAEQANAVRLELAAQMAAFPFAACVPFGHEHSGVLFRAAGHEAPPREALERVERLLGLHGTEVLRYEDRRRGQRRAMRLVADGKDTRLEAFALAGDASAEAWVRALLQQRLPAQAFGRALLSPGAKAPVPLAPRGPQVCTCLDVSEHQIAGALAQMTGLGADQRLARLKTELRCGTNCGSCLPELKRMIESASMAA